MARADADVPAQSLLLGGAALLLGRAAAGGLVPLAIAFAAAALAARSVTKPPAPASLPLPDDDVPVFRRLDPLARPSPAILPLLALAVGATVGAATRVDMMAALGQAAGVVLAWIVLRYGPSPVARGMWAAVIGAIPARLAAAGGLDLGSLVLLAVTVVLAAVLQAIFARALDAARRESVAGEHAVAAGVLAGALVAGVGPIQVGPFAVSGFATAIAALWLAQGGPAVAAAGCVALGTIAAAAGALTPLGLAALAVGALAAGFASPYSRFAAAVGLVAGEAVVTAPATLAVGPGLAGVAVGAALVCAVPATLWPAAPGTGAVTPNLQRWLSERLRRVASAVSAVGASIQETTAGGIRRPEAMPGGETTASAVDDVVRAVCPGCSAYNDCWDRKFLRAYRMVDDLLLLAEARPVRRGDVGGSGPDEIDCLRPSDMARGINLRAELGVRAARMAARMGESRRLMASQMQGLAQVLEEVAAAAALPSSGPPARRVLRYEYAVAELPRSGREECGDSHLVRELGDGRLLLGLSDGMGSGPRAALQSSMAVTLLERLLQAGFPPEVAVRTVNASLLLRAPDEAFTTLDVALLDLAAASAQFFKLGAPWGYHLDGAGDITVIGPDAPPAGALADVSAVAVSRELHPGDELVLCTDGVALAGAQPRWLADLLAGVPATDALGADGGTAVLDAADPQNGTRAATASGDPGRPHAAAADPRHPATPRPAAVDPRHPAAPHPAAADPRHPVAPHPAAPSPEDSAAAPAGSGVRGGPAARTRARARPQTPALARPALPAPPGALPTAEDRTDAILRRALELAGTEHDDMTVVVCRLSSAQG